MNHLEFEDKLAPVVRTNQIIVGALITGVIMMAAMMALTAGGLDEAGEPSLPSGLPIFALIGAAVAAMSLVARVVVGTVLKNQSPDVPTNVQASSTGNAAVDAVVAQWQTGNIVRNAITEGAALLNVFAYSSEQQWWSLAIAGGLLLWMIVGFPTWTQLQQRIENATADFSS